MSGRWPVVIGTALVALALVVLVVIAVSVLSQPPGATSTAVLTPPPGGARSAQPSSPARPTAASTTTPGPGSLPSFGPTTTATYRSVTVTPSSGPCDRSATCVVSVDVYTNKVLDAPRDVTWTVKLVDACTGASTDVRQARVSAQAGWNHFSDDASVPMPAGTGPVAIVVVVDAPDSTASEPYRLGGTAC